jgi:hypothetical protein
MYQPLQVAETASSAVKTIYRLFNGSRSVWLSWDSQVDVAESPVYVANNSRIAYVSPDFEPRQTDITMAFGAFPYPSNCYTLGVTPPVSAPILLSVSGGSGTVETRSYVYTFVSQWGEESAPSPAMSINIAVGAFTGSISGTTLTVTDVSSGLLASNQVISGSGVLGNTIISSQVTTTSPVVSTHAYTAGGAAGSLYFMIDNTLGVSAGEYISGIGIDVDTTIVSLTDNMLMLSKPLTAQAAGVYSVYYYYPSAYTNYQINGDFGTNTINVITSSGIVSGMYIAGFGVSIGTTVSTIVGRDITLSAVLTNQITGTYTFHSDTSAATTAVSSGGASGSNTMTMANNTNLVVNQLVVGTGVPAGALITNIASNTITLSKALTAQASGNYYFYGQVTSTAVATGEAGTTTFNTTTVAGVTTGQLVSGAGIPANTTVTAVTSSTITVSNPLTAQASGSYSFRTRLTTVNYKACGATGDSSTMLNSVDGFTIGQFVTGTGIPAGTKINVINTDAKLITLSSVLTAQAAGSYSVQDAGLVGTYAINLPQTVASTSMVNNTTQAFSNGTWNVSLPDSTPANSYVISAATKAGSIVTLNLNTVFGLRALEYISISGVASGMTDLNNTFQVQSVNTVAKQITIKLDTTQTYVSGGVASRNAPHNTTNLKKRIYRTITTSTGTTYYQVGPDIDANVGLFQDNYTDVGSPLMTSGWDMPPANLQGLVTHPSGAMVGFVGNQVYMSVPYSIYAWPVTQISTLDYNVVGLGVFGQTVVATTDGRPYTITFTDPAAATPQKLDKNWPCSTKRGMTVFNEGVFYPTNLGLVYIGAMGANLVSEQYYAQRDWAALVPSSFIAAHYDDRYYAAYNDGVNSKIMVFSKDEGISFLNLQPTAMHTDRKDGEVYMASNGYVQKLNSSVGLFMPYSWKSKEFVEANPVNLGACKVDFTGAVSPAVEEAIATQNAAIVAKNVVILANPLGTLGAMNNAAVNEYKAGGSLLFDTLSAGVDGYYVSISLYVNGVLSFTKKVTDTTVWRFPAGKKYDSYAIGITGTAPVKSVIVAGTPMELKSV